MKEQYLRTATRKDEHISICLDEQVQSEGISTGLENWRFKHNPLPNINFNDIDIHTALFEKAIKTPLLISSMTGGTELAERINRALARAAQKQGWALALGSMRVALENEKVISSFRLRQWAPDIPIIANLGLVQLNYGVDASQCIKAVELTGADALVFHMNSMQEVFQPEGDTNFSGLLDKLERIIDKVSFPVGIKEVGWGIDGATAKRLENIGVTFIDVAGAGGTSWSQVERYRAIGKYQQAAASFADWGISTADSVVEVTEAVTWPVVFGSGGLKTGVDAAKVLALGASVAGFGRSLLQEAVNSIDDEVNTEALVQKMEVIEYELKVAMFGIGVSDVSELKKHERLIRV